MSNISLSMSRGAKSTVISNRFIDEFMPNANGSYVKVYIYLLRLISDSSSISLSLIAERLDETEKDIRRALKYWEEVGLISVKYDIFDQITDIVILNTEVGEEREKPAEIIQLYTEPEAVEPAKAEAPVKEPAAKLPLESRPTYSAAQVNMMMNDKELATLIKDLDRKLQRQLNSSDLQLVLFFYECLGFGPELICYLYDYCISRSKTANQYIEKVALSWAQEGIRTVEQAAERNAVRLEASTTVMKAFGFNRAPLPAEQTYIGRWFNDWGFSADIVAEACNRTVIAIGKPDFKYADRVLESWNRKKVTTMADITKLDADHIKAAPVKAPVNKRPAQSTNTFNRFPQRNYSKEDFDAIEQRLLKKQQG